MGNHWRNLLHTHALVEIHRTIARGINVEGWVILDGLVTRSNGTGRGKLFENSELRL
jgi:hypothetical protein